MNIDEALNKLAQVERDRPLLDLSLSRTLADEVLCLRAEVERLNALWKCEHETVMRLVDERDAARTTGAFWKDEHIAANVVIARLTAERDALAKRWEALKTWVPPTNRVWIVDGPVLLAKMRELEAQR